MLLTSNGRLQDRLTHPRWHHWRTYHVQVEGEPSDAQLEHLRSGVWIQHRRTLAARVQRLPDPGWGPRIPPIRIRQSIPTSWLAISLREGRNRQVRRMTAAVGLPTLRLIRVAIELREGEPSLNLSGIAPGEWRSVTSQEQKRLQDLLVQPRTPIS